MPTTHGAKILAGGVLLSVLGSTNFDNGHLYGGIAPLHLDLGYRDIGFSSADADGTCLNFESRRLSRLSPNCPISGF